MPTAAHTAKPAMAAALAAKADANGILSFADFSAVALFAPEIGYYASRRNRVGLSAETDFYTASSVGPVFGKLVTEAAATLLPAGQSTHHTLVEIGAEPGKGVFEQLAQAADAPAISASAPPPPSLASFAGIQTLPLGAAWEWPAQAVLFANELLDAQPFHRLQYLGGRWREWGVRIDADGSLSETLLDAFSEPVATALAADLPATAAEGYRLDIALAAETLLAQLLSRPWQGAFLLFDYGRLWQELLHACPEGTARAYRHHRLGTDLLAHPGEQDLTCHVCWDRLEKIATAHGFAQPRLDRQEAFFMRQSTQTIAEIIGKDPAHFDPDRQALMSLLHPGHLGSKFQVLHATRSS